MGNIFCSNICPWQGSWYRAFKSLKNFLGDSNFFVLLKLLLTGSWMGLVIYDLGFLAPLPIVQRGLGAGNGGNFQSSLCDQASIKPPHVQDLENFWAGKHVHTLEGGIPQLHGDRSCRPSRPFPMLLLHLTYHLCPLSYLFLHNNLANISVFLSSVSCLANNRGVMRTFH